MSEEYKEVVVFNYTKSLQGFPINQSEKVVLKPATDKGPSKNLVPKHYIDYLKKDITVNVKGVSNNQKFVMDKNSKPLTQKKRSYFMDFVEDGLISIKEKSKKDQEDSGQDEVRLVSKKDRKKDQGYNQEISGM